MFFDDKKTKTLKTQRENQKKTLDFFSQMEVNAKKEINDVCDSRKKEISDSLQLSLKNIKDDAIKYIEKLKKEYPKKYFNNEIIKDKNKKIKEEILLAFQKHTNPNSKPNLTIKELVNELETIFSNFTDSLSNYKGKKITEAFYDDKFKGRKEIIGFVSDKLKKIGVNMRSKMSEFFEDVSNPTITVKDVLKQIEGLIKTFLEKIEYLRTDYLLRVDRYMTKEKEYLVAKIDDLDYKIKNKDFDGSNKNSDDHYDPNSYKNNKHKSLDDVLGDKWDKFMGNKPKNKVGRPRKIR